MSNSSLVTYTALSPNTYGKRNHSIDTISIHCMVGQLSVETCGSIFSKSSARASSNYGIGTDGRIAMYVEENKASQCTSNKANDERAVTIECASDTTSPYAVNSAVYSSLIELCTDICKRNGIQKMIWSNNKSDRINHKNGCNMTAHRDFANKACVPIDSEVLTKNGWVKIGDIEIGDEIACADLDGLRISFEEVYDKVEPYQQDTYTNNELTATKDHRLVYCLQKNKEYRIDYYNELLKGNRGIYIPLAGYSKFKGLPFSKEMESFLIAVQADGHYMYEQNKNGDNKFYGIEFHLKKERKIERLEELLDCLNFEYKKNYQSDGTIKIKIYNQKGINIKEDICEKFLQDKHFTWEWLNLSPDQAQVFLEEILYWDGCVTANSYCSKIRDNLDIVNAIAALNGVGSRIIGDTVQFRETPYITLGEKTKRNPKSHHTNKTWVTCVSVKTGIFLMRQNGKTFIVGNCPGDYLYSRMGQIAEEVNKKLNQSKTGWQNDANGWWYVYSNGTYPVSTWKTIDGVDYYFKASGYMAADEFIKSKNYAEDGKLYYVDKNGAWDQFTYAWKLNNKGYWLEGVESQWYPIKEWCKVDGKWYYFDSTGYMVTGKVRIGLKNYVFNPDGSLVE